MEKELKPAFPNPAFGVAHFGQGMTLRDWFAGMALLGILSNERLRNISENSCKGMLMEPPEAHAALAYESARAMLEERDKLQQI